MIANLKRYPTMKDSDVEWLGPVPNHWEVRRNGRLFAQRNETGFGELPVLEVSLRTGVRVRDFENSERKQVMSDRDKYKRALAGDIAYNMMRMWQGAVGVAPVDGLISPAYVVARPLPGTIAAYFERLFRTPAYMQEVDNYSRGIVKDRNRLYWEDFKAIPSCYPPPNEQTAIVRYLDYVDRRVRRLVRAKRRLIALLNEQQQAVIHRAVTRGLDPDVPLKDSGVEWLGQVPAHWEVVPLKRVSRIIDGDRGSGYPTAEDFVPEGIPFLSSKAIKNGRLDLDDSPLISQDKYQALGKGKLRSGDIVMTVRGTIGNSALFTGDSYGSGFINAQMMILRPDCGRVTPAYLLQQFHSSYFKQLLFFSAYGSAQQQLTNQILARLAMPMPSLIEQAAILVYLDEATADIDAAIKRANREIELLNEYRTRLVADVVTGKLDVRDAVAALPEVDPLAADDRPADALDTDADLGEVEAALEEAEV